jgi:hypothetical protein
MFSRQKKWLYCTNGTDGTNGAYWKVNINLPMTFVYRDHFNTDGVLNRDNLLSKLYTEQIIFVLS